MANATIEDILGDAKLFQWDASVAGSIYEDAGATDPAEDADTVLAWEDQVGGELLTATTNGPTYRADYNSEGYPGLQFDGLNDYLMGTLSGVTTGQSLVIYTVSTAISGSSLFCRGNSANWSRVVPSTNSAYLQQSSGAVSHQATGMDAKRAMATLLDAGRSFIYSVQGSMSDYDVSLPAVSNTLTLGALNTGSPSQFGAQVIFEVIVADPSALTYGDMCNCVLLLNDKWGIPDGNVDPQVSGGFKRIGMNGGFGG